MLVRGVNMIAEIINALLGLVNLAIHNLLLDNGSRAHGGLDLALGLDRRNTKPCHQRNNSQQQYNDGDENPPDSALALDAANMFRAHAAAITVMLRHRSLLLNGFGIRMRMKHWILIDRIMVAQNVEGFIAIALRSLRII